MPQTPEKFFVTTPIYYVNARPHIGHAYTTIVADVLARRARAQGIPTYFLTGTDEHGQKIERSAQAAGVPPQQFTDQVSQQFRSLWDRMGLTNDDFIRTTSARHKRGVQKLFKVLQDNSKIELKSYTGSYCVSDEAFVDLPTGTPCPDCGRPLETVTEQNYFFKLSKYQEELLNRIESYDPEYRILIRPESRRNEVLSFLRGDLTTVFDHPLVRGVKRSGEVLSVNELLEAGHAADLLAKTQAGHYYVPGTLKDLSISRTSFKWGIPVPNDQDHVIYVWFDALANYMTALGYGSEDDALWQKFWPADLHLVGKEITRFHCVYWPAILMAAGIATPKAITANGWLLFDNSKMSKSKGNVVRTETILDAFGPLCPEPDNLNFLSFRSEAEKSAFLALAEEAKRERHQDLFASDVLRYFLLREIPFGQDGSFSFEALVTRYNADLTNGYGNLVKRVLSLVEQTFDGALPSLPSTLPLDRTIFPPWWESDPFATEAKFDPEILKDVEFMEQNVAFASIRDMNKAVGMALYPDLSVRGGSFFYKAGTKLTLREFLQAAVDPLLRAAQQLERTYDFARYLQIVAQHIKLVDELLSVTRPWKLDKQDTKRAAILSSAVEYVRIITLLLNPILPYATAKVWAQLGLDPADLITNNQQQTTWGLLQPGTKLGPLSPIFPRADKGLAQIMNDMESPKPTQEPIECVTGPNDPPTAKIDSPGAPGLASETLASTAADAGPRTASLAEPNPGTHVAASAAITTERPGTPSHTEAHASGIFAGQPAGGQPADASPQITIDDFARIELRVAQVVVAERIPKADKLLRLEVDLGYERRQILSGIAEWYTPEELIGRRIVVITNLAPRKMRGLESHGMLLAASAPLVEGEAGGKPHLATFTGAETLPLGSRLR